MRSKGTSWSEPRPISKKISSSYEMTLYWCKRSFFSLVELTSTKFVKGPNLAVYLMKELMGTVEKYISAWLEIFFKSVGNYITDSIVLIVRTRNKINHIFAFHILRSWCLCDSLPSSLNGKFTWCKSTCFGSNYIWAICSTYQSVVHI